jgi:hypothetical protein
MTLFVTCVTLHIAQVLTFLLSRGVSIASVHNGTRIQIKACSLDMAHLATLMTSPLVATGCRGTAGFTRRIVLTPPAPVDFPVYKNNSAAFRSISSAMSPARRTVVRVCEAS